MLDVTPHIQPKSDQLNADNLMAGPITVQITGAKEGSTEQPVLLRLAGGHMPYKPCKTMLRLMVAAWGTTDASMWVGRWLTLYRDGSVNSPDGTKNAGGIRISAMSHIDGRKSFALTEKRGGKKQWKVDPIRPTQQTEQGTPTADLDAFLADAGLTPADVDRWLRAVGKPPLAEGTPEKRAHLAAWLVADPKRLNTIRALIPTDTDTDDIPNDTDTAREPGEE